MAVLVGMTNSFPLVCIFLTAAGLQKVEDEEDSEAAVLDAEFYVKRVTGAHVLFQAGRVSRGQCFHFVHSTRDAS